MNIVKTKGKISKLYYLLSASKKVFFLVSLPARFLITNTVEMSLGFDEGLRKVKSEYI